MSGRHKLNAAVYGMFRKDGKLLFGRRLNTGYMDGRLQFPSGHIEKNEDLSGALAREMKEEVGVTVEPRDLDLVFVSHRYEPSGERDYVDFYFEITKWTGEIVNAEPEKCAELTWLDEGTVSGEPDVVDYIREVMADMSRGEKYKSMRRDG